MNLETQKIRLLERDAEWAKVASEGRDVERILSFWSDDAVTLPPVLPAVVGKAATREYVTVSLRILGFKITWTSRNVPFSGWTTGVQVQPKRSDHAGRPAAGPCVLDGAARIHLSG